MRNYLFAIIILSMILIIDRFEVLDLGGFANGIAMMLVVFAILALRAHATNSDTAN